MNIPIVIAACALLGGVLFLIAHPNIGGSSSIGTIYNDISFPTGDHIIFYSAAQQVSNLGNQLSTNPVLPLKFLGTDTHGNYLIQNNTSNQMMNVSKTAPNANAIMAIANSSSQPNSGSYLTMTGTSYNQQSGSVSNPSVSTICHLGQTCHIAGKLIIADPATCQIQTVNGVRKPVCSNMLGPFKYTMQIICVDTNAYRCNFLAPNLPTTHGETHADGTFDYPWTPAGDPYYMGSYIARMYAESESLGLAGQTIDESGDYPLTVNP